MKNEAPALQEKAEQKSEENANAINLRLIILEKWIPALITAGVGGLLVALLVPSIQANSAEEAALKKSTKQ